KDPYLQRIQRRRGQIPALQCIEQLQARHPGQRCQRELVVAEPGCLGGRPRRHVFLDERTHPALILEAIVVEPAQAPPGNPFPATAQDEARLQARQRPGANEELLQRPLAAPPGPLVAKTQTVAVKVTLAASHRTGATGDRPGRGTPRCPIELLLGHPRRHPRPPAGRAAALETTRRRRTARSATRPRGGSVAAQIAAEQPHRLVPFP